VSGSVPLADRPEGQRLLAVLQPGDVVVAAKLDRAFRSAADALETLEELKKDKIGLHLIDLGGDVCGNGISKLVFTILSAVAENERERVRDAKRHRAELRLNNGSKRQFGWDVVDGRLVPNATEAGDYRADEVNASRWCHIPRDRRRSLACTAVRCSAS